MIAENVIREEHCLTLDKISRNCLAKISNILGSDFTLHQRLNSLGLVKGTEVKVLQAAPFGGPLSIRVLGYTLSLRRSEASQIAVQI